MGQKTEDRPYAYSIPETGRQLGGISRPTVYRLVQAGRLDLRKVGFRSVITAESIEQVLEAGKPEAAAP